MLKERKRSLLVFLVTIVLCAAFAVVAMIWGVTKNKFQQKTIPSPLLSYGETGKILRELDAILPLEDKRSLSGFAPNTVDFAERAVRERKKWLLLKDFKKYKKAGIFGYIEMRSTSVELPFSIHRKIDGKWKPTVNSRLRQTLITYPFFMKENSEEIDIQLHFMNKEAPVIIAGMAFFQKGYYPLIYTDPIAFNSFFRDGFPGKSTLSQYGIEIPPSNELNKFQGRLAFQKKTTAGISKYQKKKGNTQVTLISRKDHPLLKKVHIEDSELAKLSKEKIPVLAIDVEVDDLYSKDYGILSNFDGHGRRWERLSYTRMYRNGEAVFSNFSGLRLQGGDPGRAKGLINFRLFFREEYGKTMIEGDKLFAGKAGNIKRLAVKQSEWPKWPLNSPIAYNVSIQMGVLAPPTELVSLYLNGKELGLYYIVPHLGEKQVKSIFPGEDYKYFRIRGTHHDTDKKFMAEDFLKILKADRKMTEEFASEYIDIENLTRQIFSYIINATGDFCQGLALKGESSGSKMFWYSWDMDHSYIDVPIEIKKMKYNKRERWEQPPDISLATYKRKPDKKRHPCGRVALLRRLMNEDPVFRQKTKHLFASIMNHQITEEFITTLLDDYEKKLRTIDYPDGEEYITILRDFFENREEFLFGQIEHYYPSEPPVTCHVSSNSYPIFIDGFRKEGPYEGKYFPGATLSLENNTENPVKEWQINGEVTYGNPATVTIQAGMRCEVEAIH